METLHQSLGGGPLVRMLPTEARRAHASSMPPAAQRYRHWLLIFYDDVRKTGSDFRVHQLPQPQVVARRSACLVLQTGHNHRLVDC